MVPRCSRVGALIGTQPSSLSCLYGQKPIFAAMANDAYAARVARVHPSSRTPYISQSSLAAWSRLSPQSRRSSPRQLVASETLDFHPGRAAVITRPPSPKGSPAFACPCAWVPMLGILSCLGLMSAWRPEWLRLVT